VSATSDRLRVHFIDIGPGLAMLIETPNDRRNIFIDGGKWGLNEMETYVHHFVPTTEPIYAVINTHADHDHVAGAIRIFDDYAVEQFWSTGYESDELADSWTQLLNRAWPEADVFMPLHDSVTLGEWETIDNQGTAVEADDIRVQFLNLESDPPERDPTSWRRFDEGERRNNASLVLKLQYRDISFLITGDINGRNKDHEGAAHDNEIDSEELELLVRHQQRDDIDISSTVLQVAHHGSNGSSSLPFLQAVDPDWVVIPAGHQYNHPDPDALRRIRAVVNPDSHILRTDTGDSTPEGDHRDPRSDDSFIFETDGTQINTVLRVNVN
jgi:competence protein ComEC